MARAPSSGTAARSDPSRRRRTGRPPVGARAADPTGAAQEGPRWRSGPPRSQGGGSTRSYGVERLQAHCRCRCRRDRLSRVGTRGPREGARPSGTEARVRIQRAPARRLHRAARKPLSETKTPFEAGLTKNRGAPRSRQSRGGRTTTPTLRRTNGGGRRSGTCALPHPASENSLSHEASWTGPAKPCAPAGPARAPSEAAGRGTRPPATAAPPSPTVAATTRRATAVLHSHPVPKTKPRASAPEPPHSLD